MRNCIKAVVLAALFITIQGLASAEVADSSANGFTLRYAFNVKVPPGDAYRKFFQVGNWWDSAHTYSQDAHNLTIEEKAGGCWCEKLPNGGSVKHMDVVLVIPNAMVHLRGGLGPLQAMGVVGAMEVKFTSAEVGTRIEITYAIGGYASQGLAGIAAPVNTVLDQAFQRFKAYIETGNPSAQPATK